MDSVMDPELAAEMVKLLAQELKVVRSQLREQQSGTPVGDAVSTRVYLQREEALLAEVAALKAENSSLQANISRLQDQRTSVPIKMEDDHPDLVAQYEASMDAIQRELAEAIREKNIANLYKEKSNEQLEELTSVREKYRNLKASKRECQEVIDELRSQLELFRGQCISGRKPPESDPPSFFRNTDYQDVDDQPNRHDIPIYSTNLSMGIPRTTQSHCRCDGTLRFENGTMIFAHAGIALGLILKPMYQYNPKNNGTWDRLTADIEHGQKKDLCYYDGRGWKYFGTYERIGDSTLISPENIRKLGPWRVDTIVKQTVLFQDLVPPSQVRMVENMYWEGLLQIEMFGVRCVAYDQKFAKSLFENRRDLPRSVVNDVASMSKKRKRVETGEIEGGEPKKPSISGTKVENATSTSNKRKEVEAGGNHERSKKKSSKAGRKED